MAACKIASASTAAVAVCSGSAAQSSAGRSMTEPATAPALHTPSVITINVLSGANASSAMAGLVLRRMPMASAGVSSQTNSSFRRKRLGHRALRLRTRLPVTRSTLAIFCSPLTCPRRGVGCKSGAPRATAPSRTPSASRAIALRATRLLMSLALCPLRWPSATTILIPPCGRSTISTVSPLSREAYLLTLAAAMSRFRCINRSLLTHQGCQKTSPV